MTNAQHDQRLNAMKYKLLRMERDNLKTQSKSSAQMVDDIRAMIIDESRKIYGVNRNAD